MHTPLHACMDEQRVHAGVDAHGRHRLFVPILHEGRALGALPLETDAPPGGARVLAEGFARIYADYLSLLNESTHVAGYLFPRVGHVSESVLCQRRPA